MSSLALLRTLFSYRAWAHDELLDRMESLDPELHREERHAALRLIHHCHVVDRIFAAHLVGAEHGFSTDSPQETPTLAELRQAVTESDRWYREYLDTATPDLLAASVPFTFTDGDKGCMSREEMLTHLVLHGGYHRGEVGRVMAQVSVSPPWDTFAVYLHKTDPSRRLQSRTDAGERLLSA